jgi:hypothetical protein
LFVVLVFAVVHTTIIRQIIKYISVTFGDTIYGQTLLILRIERESLRLEQLFNFLGIQSLCFLVSFCNQFLSDDWQLILMKKLKFAMEVQKECPRLKQVFLPNN